MKEVIKAYTRNPHVLRKLIRFTGYVPANIIEKERKSVTPVEISQEDQKKLLKASDDKTTIEISHEGKHYQTKVVKIYMDEANKDIDEIELAIIS